MLDEQRREVLLQRLHHAEQHDAQEQRDELRGPEGAAGRHAGQHHGPGRRQPGTAGGPMNVIAITPDSAIIEL